MFIHTAHQLEVLYGYYLTLSLCIFIHLFLNIYLGVLAYIAYSQ